MVQPHSVNSRVQWKQPLGTNHYSSPIMLIKRFCDIGNLSAHYRLEALVILV